MRIVFMGTPEFSLVTLQHIFQNHTVVGVYTQPPKPAGRGYALVKSPVQEWAEHQGIPCFYPKELKSAAVQMELKSLEPDIIVVVAYGLILPSAVLDIPPLGCYNVHFSLLPRWRGAAPMQRAIQAGDSCTGVTIMKMDTGLDTGPIVAQHALTLSNLCTYTSLSQQLSVLGAQLMLEILQKISVNTAIPEMIQPIEGVTYAHKLKKEEGFLNWNHSAKVLANAIKAFNPWPGTSFVYNHQRIKILKAAVENLSVADFPPCGTVIDQGLGIICGGFNPFTACWETTEILRPLILQKSGGKIMETTDFLRGFPIPPGAQVT